MRFGAQTSRAVNQTEKLTDHLKRCADFRYSDEEILKESESPAEESLGRIRTGLSQSDRSISSNGPSYTYGDQSDYDDSSSICYYSTKDREPLKRPQYLGSKPKITSAIYKNNVSLDLPQDGHLLSDVMAAKISVLKEEDDLIQEEQNRLGNSTSSERNEETKQLVNAEELQNGCNEILSDI